MKETFESLKSITGAKEFLAGLPEECRKNLNAVLCQGCSQSFDVFLSNRKKISEGTMASENFDEQQALNAGWKKSSRTVISGVYPSMKVLENAQMNVLECNDENFPNMKGEKMFTLKALQNEINNNGKSTLPSWQSFKAIVDSYPSYQDFFEQENPKLAGWCHVTNQSFYEVGKAFYIWCADGSYVYGDSEGWDWGKANEHSLFSGYAY